MMPDNKKQGIILVATNKKTAEEVWGVLEYMKQGFLGQPGTDKNKTIDFSPNASEEEWKELSLDAINLLQSALVVPHKIIHDETETHVLRVEFLHRKKKNA